MKASNKRKLMIKRAVMIKKLRASAVKKKQRRRRIRQTLTRFHVIATNLNNIPRSTSGWTAILTRGTTTIQANFDDFGVARFPTISTLTTVSYVLRIRNADGDLLVTRSVPSDLEVFVARF